MSRIKKIISSLIMLLPDIRNWEKSWLKSSVCSTLILCERYHSEPWVFITELCTVLFCIYFIKTALLILILLIYVFSESENNAYNLWFPIITVFCSKKITSFFSNKFNGLRINTICKTESLIFLINWECDCVSIVEICFQKFKIYITYTSIGLQVCFIL